MLTSAVEEGTGRSARVPGVLIAGKTGTAERLALGSNIYLSAFAGMVPADSPELVVVVVIDQPSYQYRWGSTLAAPAFARVVSRVLASAPDIALSPLGTGQGLVAAGGE
jgi:cell division protein FtsI (penicillin-binding protein 3)